MTEDEAQQWVAATYPRDVDRIAKFVDLVRRENLNQNLIAPSTVDAIWVRHIVDSLQLLPWGAAKGLWTDIGTGGGFPGLAIAVVRRQPIRLIEPRRKRAAFLRECAAALQLDHVEVVQKRAELVHGSTTTISARAVGDVASLLELGRNWALPITRWIMPRGRLSDDDMATLVRFFGDMFHVEQSVTSAESGIVVSTGVPR